MMPNSRINNTNIATQVTSLHLSYSGHHKHSSVPEISDERECVCRATFSEDITSQYSDERTGIKLHLCVCHIQGILEPNVDPQSSYTSPQTPQKIRGYHSQRHTRPDQST